MGSNRLMRLEGVDEFSADLETAVRDYPEAAKAAAYDLARSLSQRARMRAAARGGVVRKASESLRAYRTSGGGGVSLGGARAPYAFGAEFGAVQYRQFAVWRGNQWAGWSGGPGYFLHPTIRDEAPILIREYLRSLDLAIHSRAFPD